MALAPCLAVVACGERPVDLRESTVADRGISVLVNRSAPAGDLLPAASCPGVLVEHRLVLTAAHCVADRPATGLDVVVGGDNLCSPAEIDGQRVPVRAIHLHPLADARRTVDAALLELEEPAEAEPLPLGPADVGDAVTAFGWGRPRPNGPVPCGRVQTDLTIVPIGSCGPAGLRSARDVSVDRHICAIPGPHEDRNTCTGDSGGPVVRTDDDGDTRVVGMVSWGPSCDPDDVGVYVRTAPLREWIGHTVDSLPPLPR